MTSSYLNFIHDKTIGDFVNNRISKNNWSDKLDWSCFVHTSKQTGHIIRLKFNIRLFPVDGSQGNLSRLLKSFTAP